MNEAERIRLYNDLCDYEQDLLQYTFPSKAKEADIIRRAVAYVRGVRGKWIVSGNDVLPVLNEKGNAIDYIGAKCSICGSSVGRSSYKFCPNCGAKMK